MITAKNRHNLLVSCSLSVFLSSGCEAPPQTDVALLPAGITEEMILDKSPDGAILILNPSDPAALDYRILDARNNGQILPFPGYRGPPGVEIDSEASSTIEWLWGQTAMKVLTDEGRNVSLALLVLRKDARSGVWLFEEPKLPSRETLIELIRKHTKENPSVLHGFDTGDQDPEHSRAGVFVSDDPYVYDEHEGIFGLSLRIGGYRWSVADYILLFHTPDWVRYDLLQITRYTDKDVPGEPFAAPDSKDVLLYQNTNIPEDLRWKPAYDNSSSPGGSKDLTQGAENGEQPDEGESE